MTNRRLLQGRISAFLAASLLFILLAPCIAAAEETIPSTGETQTEESVAALPSDSVPADTTEPAATSIPTEAATVPTTFPTEAPTVPTTFSTEESRTETEAPSTESTGEVPIPDEDPLPAAFRPAPDTLWYSTSLEDVLPTDILAITVTDGVRTWALCCESAGETTPEAREVTVENGVMESSGSGLGWILSREEEGLVFRPEDMEAWLYANKGMDSLRVGTLGAPYWQFRDLTLVHVLSRRCLQVNRETGTWQTPTEPDPGQSLAFWRMPRTAPVTASPAGGTLASGASVTLSCTEAGADIYYALSADGTVFSEFTLYTQPVSLPEDGSSLYLKAYTSSPSAPPSPEMTFSYTREVQPEGKPDWSVPYGFYFGQLHAHTAVSDGKGTVRDAFRAAKEQGLDFYAVTDHSDSLDNADQGSITLDGMAVSADWAEGKAAAKEASDGSFAALYGFEMSWPQGKNLGHIATFATPGWQTWKQAGFETLENYYQALANTSGAIGQFCHPGDFYGDFEDFSHRTAAADQKMALLEVGGEGDFRSYSAYIRALDKGWHVSPSNNQSTHDGSFASEDARTVILADSLCESSLCSAIRSRRVYATDDRDLEIYFTLNGQSMGSTVTARDAASLRAFLYDPTDGKLGLVEVLSQGGTVLHRETVEKNWAELEISLPGGQSYYFLRITQADGDIAVTAPVWMEEYRDAGIQSFTAQPELLLTGEPAQLTVQLFNQENTDLTVNSLEFFLDGKSLHIAASPGVVKSGGTLSYTLPYTHDQAGAAAFQVRAVGTIGGLSRSYEQTLTLSFHPTQTAGQVCIFSSLGQDPFSRFVALAADADLKTSFFTTSVPAEGDFLVVTAPAEGSTLPAELEHQAAALLARGGSLILCGQAGQTQELNRLLRSLGSTMALGGTTPSLCNPAVYQSRSPYTSSLWKRQFYYHQNGCALSPGEGTWLVKHPENGDVLLAWESLREGRIFLSGASLLSGEDLPLTRNQWDAPSANQGILEAIFGLHRQSYPLSTISQARSGEIGAVFRIQGYATTGTSNPSTTLPNTLCLQDSTGGIPIVDFADTGIAVGTFLDVIGVRRELEGSAVLALIDYSVPGEPAYRYVPKVSSCSFASNYALQGGRLVQTEGTVASLLPTEDKKGLSQLVLKDDQGDSLTVIIGSTIASGATGENTLASEIRKGRTVRATGIVYMDHGRPVLRVRNCDEVVDVAPIPDPTNPKVGDALPTRLGLLLLTAAVLLLLLPKVTPGKNR